jgi:hypothetical protein
MYLANSTASGWECVWPDRLCARSDPGPALGCYLDALPGNVSAPPGALTEALVGPTPATAPWRKTAARGHDDRVPFGLSCTSTYRGPRRQQFAPIRSCPSLVVPLPTLEDLLHGRPGLR